MIKYYQRLINRLNPWQIALLAALIYGLWAGWVNSEYGHYVALRTGLLQGSYAFLSTALVSFVAKQLLIRFNYSPLGRLWALLGSWLIMLAIPIMLHTWQQTPDLFEAILPGIIIGSIYLWVYCQQSQRVKKIISHD